MAQLSPTTETIRDGGFHIDIQPDEIAITADKSAWKTRSKPFTSRILFLLTLLAVVLAATIDLPKDGPVALAVIMLIFAPAMLIAYVRGCKNLRCNHQYLQVVRVARGRIASTANYPRDSVQKIRFGAVSYYEYGAVCGLIFNVQGRDVKVLKGLESPEALRILTELRRLGFDTVQDVGMPMMAEMAIERRNSWFRR